MTTQTNPQSIATLARKLAFDALVSAEQRATRLLNEIALLDRETTNADYQLSNDALEVQKQRAREFILALNLQGRTSWDMLIANHGIYVKQLSDRTWFIAWDSWDVACQFLPPGKLEEFAEIATHSLTVRF